MTLLLNVLESGMLFCAICFAQKWRLDKKELERDNHFMDLVIENIPGVLFVRDAKKLEYKIVNRKVLELFGRSREQVIGHGLYQLFSREVAERLEFYDRQILSGKRLAVNEDIEVETVEGPKIFQTKEIPIFDRYGKIVYLLGIAHDVSKSRDLQQKVVKIRQGMFKREHLLTMGTIAGGVAHEINNPLGVLSLVSGRLKKIAQRPNDDLDVKKILDHCQKLDSMVGRVSNIVHGLVSVSCEGEKQDSPEVKDLRQIVASTMEMCQARIAKGSVSISVEGDLSQRVACRESEVCQVLLNLLVNAHDEIGHRENAWICLRASRMGEQAVLSVIDCGDGIPAKALDKIMKPFYTTKSAGKGLGLGLNISKKIMESHGGNLKIDTTCKNTKFDMILPLWQNQEQAQEAA